MTALLPEAADTKRQRVGSFEHASLPAPRPPPLPGQHHHPPHPPPLPPPPPPPATPPTYQYPHHASPVHQQAPRHPHYQPHHPTSSTSHSAATLPPPPAPAHLSHYQHSAHPTPGQHQQHQQPPPPPQPLQGPSASHASDYRQRPYSSHAPLPMPAPHHPEPSTDPSQYRHRPPQPPPPPPPPGYHLQHYSNDSVSSRTPTTPSQPGSAIDSNARHAPPYDPYRQQPHEPAQHSPYPASGQNTPHPLALHQTQDAQRAYGYHSMPPQPSESSPYEAQYGYGPSMGVTADGQPKRKAVRASQACESCRQKKCKCDEERPICGNCAANGTECSYRHLPPPKQERNMMQVIDSIAALGSQLNEMRNYFNAAFGRREEMELLHRELRDFREEVRGSQGSLKRASEYSQSPASRSHFASPRPVQGHADLSIGPGSGRLDPSRHVEMQNGHTLLDSPAGSHHSESGPSIASKGTPQQPNYRNMAPSSKFAQNAITDESIRKFDPLAGQLSIPIEHTTAAHKLLIAWDAIHPFYEGIIGSQYAKNYVWHEETQRGQLRMFGQGEGQDGLSSSESFPGNTRSPSSSELDSLGGGSSAADGFWGVGFDAPLSPPFDTAGGLTPEGCLALDRPTLNRLFKSFMDHIWLLHPFFNEQHVTGMCERFARRHCPDEDPGQPGQPGAANASPTAPSMEIKTEAPPKFRAMKRKRSDGTGDETERVAATKGSPAPGESRRMPLERSVNNAVILLILALGGICDHRDPLPAPVFTPEPGSKGRPSPDRGLNPSSRPAKSPKTTHSPWSGQGHAVNGASRASSNGSTYLHALRNTRKVRNVDRIPGLAYYAYATGILGEQHGAPDLAHVHARILAGIYMAQLARVIDSWSWIHSACVACKLLFRDEDQLEKEVPAERADAIRFAFWTCLQLESDILAELSELPHSGISRLEELMPLPRWSTLHYAPGSGEQRIITYYNAQIHIRKILNRAHSALYNSGKESLKNPGWTIFTADDLALQLSEWKNSLPPGLNWKDEDEPAHDINDARLRGKYYGAQYMIHRPFLHHLLQDEFAKPVPDVKKLKTLKTREKEDIISMARKCIEAAVRSTLAFDGLPGRPIITNIFGTAHAQFGNVLVLAACHMSQKYRWFTNRHDIEYLIERTSNFVGALAPLAPTMRTNLKILRHTMELVRSRRNHRPDEAASTSFGSST